MKPCFSPHAQHLNAQQAWTWSKLGWSLLTPYLTSAVCLLIGLSNMLSCTHTRKHNLRVSRSDRWSSVQLLKRISQYHALLSWDLVLWNNKTYYFLMILHWYFMALHQYLLFIHFLFLHWYDFKLEMSGNSKLKLIKSYVLTIGVEDNTGVRRVVVTPQSPECYPPSYSPAISPTHHLPPYMAPPPFIPNSHTAFYPPVSPGDIPPHQFYQHHIPPMYNEGKSVWSLTYSSLYSPLTMSSEISSSEEHQSFERDHKGFSANTKFCERMQMFCKWTVSQANSIFLRENANFLANERKVSQANTIVWERMQVFRKWTQSFSGKRNSFVWECKSFASECKVSQANTIVWERVQIDAKFCGKQYFCEGSFTREHKCFASAYNVFGDHSTLWENAISQVNAKFLR